MAGGPGLTPDRALKVLHAARRGKVIFTLSLSCPSPLFPIPQEEAAGCETRPPVCPWLQTQGWDPSEWSVTEDCATASLSGRFPGVVIKRDAYGIEFTHNGLCIITWNRYEDHLRENKNSNACWGR